MPHSRRRANSCSASDFRGSAARTRDRSRSIARSRSAPTGPLKLKNFSGDVRVTGTSGSDVVIHAVRRATRERLDNIKLEITTSGSSVDDRGERPRPKLARRRTTTSSRPTSTSRCRSAPSWIFTPSRGSSQVTGVSGRIDAETFSGNIELDVATAKAASADRRRDVQRRHSRARARRCVRQGGVQQLQRQRRQRSADRDADERRRNVSGDIGSGGGPTLQVPHLQRRPADVRSRLGDC